MSSRSQRFSPIRRALVRPSLTTDMTDIDASAKVYRVAFHGEQTLSELTVLAIDEAQAKQQAVLRWTSQGIAVPDKPTLSARHMSWAGGEMKAAILSFESEDEWQLRNSKGTAA